MTAAPIFAAVPAAVFENQTRYTAVSQTAAIPPSASISAPRLSLRRRFFASERSPERNRRKIKRDIWRRIVRIPILPDRSAEVCSGMILSEMTSSTSSVNILDVFI